MKQYPVTNILLTLTFIIFIGLPITITAISETEQVSKTEKRNLAKFPRIELSQSTLKKFPRDFEKYIEDHFGFRNEIVKMHNYTLYKVLNVSPSSMVVIGNDDWLFFNANGAIPDYLGRIDLSKEKLRKIDHLLQDRSYWLNSIGAHYLFLPIPNKESIYEEHLPAQIRKNRGSNLYEQILGHVKERGHFNNYIDVQEIMAEKKKEQQLYLRTDSHWNHDGTYLVYQSIISKLENWFPDILPLKQESTKKWIENFSGDLTILMNLKGVITETAPDLNIKEECKTSALQRMTQLKDIPEYSELPSHRLPVENGCPTKKYKAILIHDSFGNFLRPYLSQHFETVIYINYLNFEDAKTVIELEKPDIVIDQRVARNLLKGVKSDEILEQLVIQDKFDQLPDLRGVIDGSKWKESLFALSGATAQEFEGTIEIKFGSQPSSVAFRLDKTDRFSDPSAVKIDLVSDMDNEISICYKTSDSDGQRRGQCKKRVVREGQNSLFFRIIDPDKRGLLEFRSLNSGRFFINSIVAKRERGDR